MAGQKKTTKAIRVGPTSVGVLSASFAGLALFSCLFETRTILPEPNTIQIDPDLNAGNRWAYRHILYTEHEDGSKSDTTTSFIRYEIIRDSAIEGVDYKIMLEEDLGLFNTDFGLVINRSLYALRYEASGLIARTLRHGDPSIGRLPFKTSAYGNRETKYVGFDSILFRDEITALTPAMSLGRGWRYREPGNPFNLMPATKTFLGLDSISLMDTLVSALKFGIEVDNATDVRIFEWYIGELKVFSRLSASLTYRGKDSIRVEENYLGKRAFILEDTLLVLKGTVLDPMLER